MIEGVMIIITPATTSAAKKKGAALLFRDSRPPTADPTASAAITVAINADHTGVLVPKYGATNRPEAISPPITQNPPANAAALNARRTRR